jgi:hypothetical protein
MVVMAMAMMATAIIVIIIVTLIFIIVMTAATRAAYLLKVLLVKFGLFRLIIRSRLALATK